MSEIQTGPADRPLREILAAVNAEGDLDAAHILAGAINLYLESIRRLGRRNHLAAEDIFKIFSMAELLLGAGDLDAGIRQLVGNKRQVQ